MTHWLIIGGTQFVGHHIVQAALAQGDAVTLFNRGKTASSLPAGVRHIAGDRKGDLSALAAAGPWDAVIDCCAYLPADAQRMAQALVGKVGRYVFISTVSVYASFAQGNAEDSPLGTIEDVDTQTIDGRTYGPLKALCEAAFEREAGVPVLHIRPGLVVGPQDPTQRFTYWPARVARALPGETVLVAGRPEDPLQFIDVRDLAAFSLQAAQRGLSGAYNLVNDPASVSLADLLHACAKAAGSTPQWRWLPADRLQALGLRAWVDFPAWAPHEGETFGFAHTANARARAAGLQTRPLADTVRDTLAWYRQLPAEQQAFSKAGLTPEREAQVLAAL